MLRATAQGQVRVPQPKNTRPIRPTWCVPRVHISVETEKSGHLANSLLGSSSTRERIRGRQRDVSDHARGVRYVRPA